MTKSQKMDNKPQKYEENECEARILVDECLICVVDWVGECCFKTKGGRPNRLPPESVPHAPPYAGFEIIHPPGRNKWPTNQAPLLDC